MTRGHPHALTLFGEMIFGYTRLTARLYHFSGGIIISIPQRFIHWTTAVLWQVRQTYVSSLYISPAEAVNTCSFRLGI